MCGFKSRSRYNISYPHHTHDNGAMAMILYKLCAVWLLNLPCVYICVCKTIACMYVIVSIKNLQFQGGECSSLHWPLMADMIEDNMIEEDRARTGWLSVTIMWLSGKVNHVASGLVSRRGVGGRREETRHYEVAMNTHCHKSVLVWL